MANFVKVNIEGSKDVITYTFEDTKPTKDMPGKLSGDKYLEFLIACKKYCKSYMFEDNEIWVNKEDAELIRGFYFDIKEGEEIEPDGDEEIIQIEGMLFTKTGELSYIEKQVCWCILFLDLGIGGTARELEWCRRKINIEKSNCKIAFDVRHFDAIKELFSTRYPDYIYSRLKEVKDKVKRIRVRRKKS